MPVRFDSRASTHSHRHAGSALTTGLIVLALIAVAAAVYLASAGDTVQGVDHDRLVKSLGLGSPVANGLADGYVDADGDLLADAPTQTRDPETLRFCYIAGASNISPSQFEALLRHIESAVGKPVEYVTLASDDAQLLALANGELDIAGFNTGGVPRAVNVAGFVPCAAPVKEGEPASYRMVLITPAGSDLAKPEDIAGRSIAFTSRYSNSGTKAPLVLLRDRFKLRPSYDYDWRWTYGHDASIAGIAEGRLEAAATASDLLAAAVANGQIKESDYRVLYESEPFPVAALGYAHDLDPALAQKIESALLSFEATGTPVVDALAGADGLTPVNYKDEFALIRRIDDAAGFKHQLPESAGEEEKPSESDASETAA